MPRAGKKAVVFGEDMSKEEREERRRTASPTKKERAGKGAKRKREVEEDGEGERGGSDKVTRKANGAEDSTQGSTPASPKKAQPHHSFAHIPRSPVKTGGMKERAPPSPSKPRGKGTGHGQTTSTQNKIYLDNVQRILKAMNSLEYSSLVDTMCPCGRHTADTGLEKKEKRVGKRVWRCLECSDQDPCCSGCLRDRHINSPFHRVQHWTGRFYDQASLLDVGLAIHLGHAGSECPTANPKAAPISMTIGDISGFHELPLHLCQCHGHGEEPEPMLEQLVKARYFPATFANPRTMYTFRLLDHWHADITQGKKPVYDYFLSLKRRTKVGAKDLVGDYRPYTHSADTIYRTVTKLSSERGATIETQWRGNRVGKIKVSTTTSHRTGIAALSRWCVLHAPNQTSTFKTTGKRKRRSPRKGERHETRTTGWLKLIKMTRCKYVKTYAIDATFKPSLKPKPRDEADRSLNQGSAYFYDFDDFLAYETKFKDHVGVKGKVHDRCLKTEA